MAKDNAVVIKFGSDDTDIMNSFERIAKKMGYVRESSKKTQKEVKTLGDRFSQTANQVAIMEGPLGPIAGRLSAIGSGLNRFSVGSFAVAGGVSAMTLAIGKALKGLDNFEKRQIRFNSLLEVTRFKSGATATELENMAQAFGLRTLGSADQGAKALNILVSQTDIAKDKFGALLDTAFGVSEITGKSFERTLLNIAKALTDPARNASTLATAVGRELPRELTKSINALVEMGDKAKANEEILKLLGDEYARFATRSSGLEGDLDALGQNWDLMWERIGRTGVMEDIYKTFNDAVKGVNGLLVEAADAHGPATKASERLANATKAYNLELERSKNGPFNDWANVLLGTQKYLINTAFGTTELQTAQRRLREATRAFAEEERQELESKKAAREGELRSAVESAEKQVKIAVDAAEKMKRASEVRSEGKGVKVERQYQERVKSLEDAVIREVTARRKLRDANIAAGEDETKENATFLSEKTRLEREFTERLKFETQSRNDKIGEIERVANDKRIAEQQRAFRQFQATSLALAGGDELSQIKSAYDAQVKEFENKTYTQEQAAAHGFKNEKELRLALNEALKKSYDDDVAAYRKTRQSFIGETLSSNKKLFAMEQEYKEKLGEVEELTIEDARLEGFEATVDGLENLQTELNLALYDKYNEDVAAFLAAQNKKLVDSAGIMASIREQFSTGIDLAVNGDGGGFFENFFDFDVDTAVDKISQIESTYLTALDNIANSELEKDEKIRLSQELGAKFGKEQADLKKQGEVKAAQDTWGALQSLGSSGSKKLFAIAKAAKIGQAIMNTYMAATNALANIPPPFNIGAAALITANGLAQVAQIRAQQPQFHDGIDNVPRTGTYLLEGGERVVDKRLNVDLKNFLKTNYDKDDDRKRYQGMFHDGIDNVPSEGSYLLDGGERVLDNRLNGDLKNFIKTNESQAIGGDINFNVAATDTGGFDNWYNDNRDMIVRDVEYARKRL